MPDLQTEMQKVLQAWETPETTETKPEEPMFTPTTNTSRATFEAVRDDPGLGKPYYVRKLVALGHKKSSVYSLLAQMVRQGHIWVGTSGGLHPNQKEYAPLKCTRTLQNKAKKATKTSKVRTSKPEVAPVPLEEVKQAIIGKPLRSKIDTILDEISLSDAHELYRQLHKYFGGLPK